MPKFSVLIIEDEKAIQSVLYELLIEAGYLVTLADDGLEGLSQFRKQTFSLVLLDIMMPDVDGLQFCHEIRNQVDCPILFITAKTQETDIVQGLTYGADDYITKPFKLAVFLSRINALLRRSEHFQYLRYGD